MYMVVNSFTASMSFRSSGVNSPLAGILRSKLEATNFKARLIRFPMLSRNPLARYFYP